MSARTVTILGATGSVGRATLDLIARAREGAYDVIALTARDNIAALSDLARRFRPRFVAVADPNAGAALKEALGDLPVDHGAGPEAVETAAAMEADWTMAAIVGAAGLKPTLAAVRRGACVAFANKEALVCAGALFMETAARAGSTLLPVDSEHNAIFQAFDPAQRAKVRRIVLTASGGPFRTASLDEMAAAGPDQALAHPTWSMGAKISIDCATLMNKGLEVIEACWLFDLPAAQVDVLVHKESIVHGLVEYADGGWLAQLGAPDMRTPIAHALAWPDRMETPVERLDLAALSGLAFEAPDETRFPALGLCRTAMERGGALPAVLNAANEVAVAAFLAEHIGFLDIARTVAEVLAYADGQGFSAEAPADFEAVFAADEAGRAWARETLGRRAGAGATLTAAH